MLSTTMELPPADQTLVRSSPFQARALHIFKKFSLGSRKSGKKSKDSISPVAIPSGDFQRAHSSVDLLRKPDISQLIGFRSEDGPSLMDTDDSSQDASPSSNSPHLRPRRHSTLDSSRTAPIHSTFSAHGAAPLFCRDQAGLGSQNLAVPGKLLAPAPLFLRSDVSFGTIAQPPPTPDPGLSPKIPPRTSVSAEPKPDEEVVQDTPQPSQDVFPYNDTFTNSSAGLSPPVSPDPGIIWCTQSPSASAASTSGTVQERPNLSGHHNVPLPPPFRLATERGLRLSPSIITRQPMPLLNLPALPPPPPVQDTPSRQRVRLQSMPSLSRHGRSKIESQAKHESVTVGDSDEDYGDDGDEGDEEEFIDASSLNQSDDEDDEPLSAGPSGTRSLKSSQKQPVRDDDSSVESPISPVSPQSVFVGSNLADYFCSKTYVRSIHVASTPTLLSTYPFSPDVPGIEDAHTLDPDLSVPGTVLESKPSLGRVASRSMTNLGPTWRAERPLWPRETIGSNPASVSGHTIGSHEESEESDTELVIGRLFRRTSMPSFHPTSDPPPYPTFHPRPKESGIAPRDDEGRERLPAYSNSLYLIATMPRKMEFSSPGVQAKDRKWRRVVCELEGTTFRVYKCPPGASGAGVLGDWWEKRVGAGDVAGPNPTRTRRRDPEEQPEMPMKLGIDATPTPVTPQTSTSSARSTSVPPARRRAGSQSSTTSQSTMISAPRQAKRVSTASFLSPFRGSTSIRAETSTAGSLRPGPRELELLPVDTRDSHSSLSRSSLSHESRRLSQPPQPRSASRVTFLPVTAGRTTWRSGEIPHPSELDLLRSYTLQHAESGLGNDYLKRKNVIRVRLEGEQFLLQAPDIPTVVEWIEALHAGTNIALDIDQRTMPRGPMFPRRRRRRARRTQAEDTSGGRPSGPP